MSWVFKLLAKSPWISTEILLSSLVINILGLASAVYVIQVYGRYLVHGIDGTLITLATGMLIVIAMELLFRRLRYRMGMKLVAQRDREDSEHVLSRLLNANAEALMRMQPGMRQMFLNRNEQLQQTLNPTLFIALVDAPFALLYLFAIFLISTFIGWSVLVVLLVTVVLFALVGFKLRNLTQAQMSAQAGQSDTHASLDRFEMVRNAGAAPYLTQQWKEGSQEVRWWKYLVGKEQDFLQSINQTLLVLMTVVVISLGAREVVQGNIDFGMLIGMNILAARAMMLMTKPSQSIAALLRAKAMQKFLTPIENLPQEQEKGAHLNSYVARLEFKSVSFGYQAATGMVFENLNVHIPEGALVKVLGSNGAGKTTLCRLLVNVLQPRRGQVLLDGVDLRQFNALWWRRQLIYVPQEPEFMNDTLQANLMILNPEVSESRLKEIIQQVGLSDFVDRHPEGLTMMLKDGGRSLPLGIKRRMAVARAMVSEGKIVIIDEPTEGFDNEGVTMMAKLIQLFSQQGKTVFVMMSEASTLRAEGITIDLNQKPVPKVLQPMSFKGA